MPCADTRVNDLRAQSPVFLGDELVLKAACGTASLYPGRLVSWCSAPGLVILLFGVVTFAGGCEGRVAAAPSCVVFAARPRRRVAGGASMSALVLGRRPWGVGIGWIHEWMPDRVGYVL